MFIVSYFDLLCLFPFFLKFHCLIWYRFPNAYCGESRSYGFSPSCLDTNLYITRHSYTLQSESQSTSFPPGVHAALHRASQSPGYSTDLSNPRTASWFPEFEHTRISGYFNIVWFLWNLSLTFLASRFKSWSVMSSTAVPTVYDLIPKWFWHRLCQDTLSR